MVRTGPPSPVFSYSGLRSVKRCLAILEVRSAREGRRSRARRARVRNDPIAIDIDL